MSGRVVAVLAFAAGLVPALALGGHGASAQGSPPSIEEVSQRMDELYRSHRSVARIELTVVRPRQTRTLRLKVWSLGRERSLSVIEAPAREAGMATLRRDRNLWNYLPRISRTVRVPPSMMQAGWMGSDLTNDDLTRSSSLEKDFTRQLVGRSTSPAGWLYRFDAKPEVVGLWRRIEYVISDDGTLPLEARNYDRRLKIARVMRFSDVATVDGRRIPTRVTMVPRDREGYRTEVRYLDIDFDAKVSESTFSLATLERRR